ncbi:hypothetical protein [Clostridioides difficile]|uniref:hypothetical protein n=1 Tax=Clostridioides difficile TaxID=1496 RepID=UPI000D1E3109|nr:hypothetical protein [Clostridioides difficile]HBE9444666.1 hypothetical protein [Clostridioides difficile]
MIQCNLCGGYFHSDEIDSCPNTSCSKELCSNCYQEHVTICLNSSFEDDDYVEEKYPSKCPYCDEELELDLEVEGDTIIENLICPNPYCDKNFSILYKEINNTYEEE